MKIYISIVFCLFSYACSAQSPQIDLCKNVDIELGDVDKSNNAYWKITHQNSKVRGVIGYDKSSSTLFIKSPQGYKKAVQYNQEEFSNSYKKALACLVAASNKIYEGDITSVVSDLYPIGHLCRSAEYYLDLEGKKTNEIILEKPKHALDPHKKIL